MESEDSKPEIPLYLSPIANPLASEKLEKKLLSLTTKSMYKFS